MFHKLLADSSFTTAIGDREIHGVEADGGHVKGVSIPLCHRPFLIVAKAQCMYIVGTFWCVCVCASVKCA